MPTGLPGRLARTDRPVLMGVVNVTPDSFSDGGRWATPEAAVAHGRDLLVAGADILDVGGESTRPGATRPLVEEELARVVPVIRALAADGAVVSVDTMRGEVASAALEAGAVIVNDVSGGLADPDMLPTVARTGAAYVAMHWRAHSDTMQQYATYDGPGGPGDVVTAVRDELADRVEAILAAGIPRQCVVLDPGLGFAKTAEHNWELLRGLGPIAALGFPVLVGASRKAFLGSLLAGPDGVARGVEDREHASSALHVLLAQQGVWGLRTHDVRAAHDALRALARWNRTPRATSASPSTEVAP
jgi:dihydropteroate synthase